MNRVVIYYNNPTERDALMRVLVSLGFATRVWVAPAGKHIGSGKGMIILDKKQNKSELTTALTAEVMHGSQSVWEVDISRMTNYKKIVGDFKNKEENAKWDEQVNTINNWMANNNYPSGATSGRWADR